MRVVERLSLALAFVVTMWSAPGAHAETCADWFEGCFPTAGVPVGTSEVAAKECDSWKSSLDPHAAAEFVRVYVFPNNECRIVNALNDKCVPCPTPIIPLDLAELDRVIALGVEWSDALTYIDQIKEPPAKSKLVLVGKPENLEKLSPPPVEPVPLWSGEDESAIDVDLTPGEMFWRYFAIVMAIPVVFTLLGWEMGWYAVENGFGIPYLTPIATAGWGYYIGLWITMIYGAARGGLILMEWLLRGGEHDDPVPLPGRLPG